MRRQVYPWQDPVQSARNQVHVAPHLGERAKAEPRQRGGHHQAAEAGGHESCRAPPRHCHVPRASKLVPFSLN